MADAAPDTDHQSWAQRTLDSVKGLLHEAPLPTDGSAPQAPPKWQVIAANVASRAIVYGPFLTLAAIFMPLAIPSLLLAAGQPWTGEALSWASQKIQKYIPATKPLFDKIGKLTGNKWWPAIGALAVATIPAPALLHTLAHHLPGFISSAIGSVDGIWTQALPFVLITALPTAQKLVEKVLDKLPVLRDAALVRKWMAAAEKDGGDVFKDLDVAAPDGGDAPAPAPQAPAPAAPEAGKPGVGQGDTTVKPVLRALPLQTTPMRPIVETTDTVTPHRGVPPLPQAATRPPFSLDI